MRESEKDRRERQDIENEYGWVLFARHLGQSESHKCTVPHLFRSPHLCACVLASRSVKSRWIGDSIERTSQTKPEKKERRKSEKKEAASFGIIFSASFPRNFGMRKESYVARFAERLSERRRKEKGGNYVCALSI